MFSFRSPKVSSTGLAYATLARFKNHMKHTVLGRTMSKPLEEPRSLAGRWAGPLNPPHFSWDRGGETPIW